MTFPHGQTITVIRGGKDRRTGVWTETSRHDITGCAIDWNSVTELVDGQDMIIINATVYASAGSDITATDLVLIGPDDPKNLYDVVGDPASWVSPFTGWAPGMSIRLIHHRG